MRWIIMALAATLLAAPAWADDPPLDLLAFSNGALIERTSPSYGSGWEGIWLLDEAPGSGWANQDTTQPPFEIVISLPERSRFSRFVFDTAAVESAARSAKDVDIMISDQSATTGFTKIMAVVLGEPADGQGFDVPPTAAATGRWVKFVIRTNHGDDKYWEIMNLHGFGTALTTTKLADVSGTYDSAAYGRFHLAQSGAQLTGCYEHAEGLVQGGLEAHLMRLTCSENQGANSGPAVMVATRDGKGFQGLWRNGNESGWNDNWKLTKVSNDIGFCPHWRPTGARGSMIGDTLSAQGRVRLYGINFDTDSDRLRPDASPTLDQLKAALAANPGWRIVVEGHTDSTSTAAHNLDLSARRAAAVKAYLVAGGIPAARLETKGLGQDQPAAPNDTALGRAQNRRVEVVRQ